MSRRPLMVGNWKMHKTVAESLDLVKKLKEALPVLSDRDVLICPPFTALWAVREVLEGTPIFLGAQNMSENLSGAFTGEVSPLMLQDTGCSYVILGHSERRHYYGETDVLVNRKIRRALEQGLTPILCLGEGLEEREAGKTFEVLARQRKESLANFSAAELQKTVIAYEPVWAIGTGKTATPDQAQEVHAFLRRELERSSGSVAMEVRILYGGSVKPENIDALMAQPDIDGGLVGGASLKAEDFVRLVKFQTVEMRAMDSP